VQAQPLLRGSSRVHASMTKHEPTTQTTPPYPPFLPNQSKPNRLHNELELQRHSLTLLQQRIASSESSQLAEALTATEAEAEATRAAKEAAVNKRKEMAEMAKVRVVGLVGGWVGGWVGGSTTPQHSTQHNLSQLTPHNAPCWETTCVSTTNPQPP